MEVGDGLHLTYCTNIHPAIGWEAVLESLRAHAPALKARLSPDAPFGIGLRLSGAESSELLEGDRLGRFRGWLDAEGLYVFTINGFPHGAFHGRPVKADVHAPDWRTEERVAYTLRLAEILDGLLPEGVDGTISTSPLSYARGSRGRRRGALHGERRPGRGRAARHADRARHRAGARRRARRHRRSRPLVGRPLDRDHVTVCFDACHAAVAYEEPATALDALDAAGIRVGKAQLSAALQVAGDGAGELARFADPIYLHQVTQRSADGTIATWPDLPEALAALGDGRVPGALPRADLRRALRSARVDPGPPARHNRARAGPDGAPGDRDVHVGRAARRTSRPPRWTRSRASTSGCSVSSADALTRSCGAALAGVAAARPRVEHADRGLQRGGGGRGRVGAAPAGTVAVVAVAMALFYTAGMILNDVADLEVDRRERPERPLPSGAVSRTAALAAFCALSGAGRAAAGRDRRRAAARRGRPRRADRPLRPLAQGQRALARAHGRLPGARLCDRRAGRRRLAHRRAVGRGGAAARLRGRPDPGRQGRGRRDRGALARRWPCSPRRLLGQGTARARGRAPPRRLPRVGACALWLVLARRQIGAGVVRLIAGIAIYDALVVAASGGGAVALAVCLAAFAATIALQTKIAGT